MAIDFIECSKNKHNRLLAGDLGIPLLRNRTCKRIAHQTNKKFICLDSKAHTRKPFSSAVINVKGAINISGTCVRVRSLARVSLFARHILHVFRLPLLKYNLPDNECIFIRYTNAITSRNKANTVHFAGKMTRSHTRPEPTESNLFPRLVLSTYSGFAQRSKIDEVNRYYRYMQLM